MSTGVVRDRTPFARPTAGLAANQPESIPGNEADTAANGPGLDAPIAVRWRFEAPGVIDTPPTIDGGAVYVVTQNSMDALDIVTGASLWSTNSLFDRPASPIVYHDLVIVYSITGNSSLLQAFERQSGAERWRIGGEGDYTSSIVISNERAWFGAQGALYSFNPDTGQELVEIALDVGVGGTPMAANGLIIVHAFATEPVKLSLLIALDPIDGTRRWSRPDFPGVRELVATSDALYVDASWGDLYAIEVQDGEERWHVKLQDDIQTKPSVASGLVFVSDGYSIVALDTLNGETQQMFATGNDPVSTVQATSDGVLYAASHARLAALQVGNSAELWRYPTNNALGTPIITAGEGIVCTVHDSTHLIAFGNVLPMRMLAETTLYGTPSTTGVARGTASPGAEVSYSGTSISTGDTAWLNVTVDGVNGWIPQTAIDPLTLPTDGAIELVYTPS